MNVCSLATENLCNTEPASRIFQKAPFSADKVANDPEALAAFSSGGRQGKLKCSKDTNQMSSRLEHAYFP